MAIVSSGTISIHTAAGTDRSITGEFGGTAPHALSEYYRGGANVPSGATGVPANGTIKLSDFYGAANTFATTNISSITANSFSSDSSVTAGFTFSVIYVGSLIRVQVSVDGDDETSSPNTVSTVFSITNAPSGYTVKHGTISDGTEGHSDPITQSGDITSSAISIPTSGSAREFQLSGVSGGSAEDGAQTVNHGSGSLIFEKSGDTTYTYSFTYEIDAENEGSGGE
jgi:hypothetical protein|tara:strand:- start:999 stop:1676 length:678 start_codon:yes stop_codon:yes gene_type:complete